MYILLSRIYSLELAFSRRQRSSPQCCIQASVEEYEDGENTSFENPHSCPGHYCMFLKLSGIYAPTPLPIWLSVRDCSERGIASYSLHVHGLYASNPHRIRCLLSHTVVCSSINAKFLIS
ncbi:hypothetical protein AVEN_178743-1 [Araneus ventricosus]|uniref:Uncharacterized protein n=1 Tax=Araneus ventricosus TaxID=182803 RepID=A0A4Y2I287_ARAVE|nr:hypothetical protein AVEN_178743-1 [Araneus ventricosus]